MTRKKNKTKKSQLRDKENLNPHHVSTLKQKAHIAMPPPGKRSLPADAEGATPHSIKRPKNAAAHEDSMRLKTHEKDSRDLTTGANDADNGQTLPANVTEGVEPDKSTAPPQSGSLPTEIQPLASKYNFTTMSIISSSKMQVKVRTLLDCVSKFSFADLKSNPGVAVLHAKAAVANKLVGIVEIAKEQIEKEKGNWWQYSKVEGQMIEVKPKQLRRAGGGKTLKEWHEEKSRGVDQDVERADGGENSGVKRRLSKEDGKDDGNDDVEENGKVDGDDDEEDEFETMRKPERASDEGQKKIRNIPIMTVYFARVSVPDLKYLYGYVCHQALVSLL